MKMKTNIMGLALMALLAGNAHAAVLANVGEKTINDNEIRGEYESMPEDQKKTINEDSSTRRNIVESAINAEILVQAAKKAGLEKDEDYKKSLERFQRQYLATKFMQKAIEPKLAKTELKKFYDENKPFFDTTQVCAYHIVMKEEDEAKKVLALAKTKETKFEALAIKHSLDPTVQENKGNLGCFTRDRMVPEFAAAAFNMKKGEIQGPVHTIYGYHIIKVVDTKPGKVPGYDEVEQRVKETYRVKLVNDLLSDLRTKSNVKVFDEEVKKFKL
jgi:peptidyl-prolyl cis-trans isomerase C